jgi:hypothetical protein
MICARVCEQLEDLELDFLEPDVARECEAHLRECAVCRAEREGVRRTLRLLEGLSEPLPRALPAPAPRVRAGVARFVVAAAAACALFAAGLGSAGLLRDSRAVDARIASIVATVAEQQKLIQQLRDERLLDQQAVQTLREELHGVLAARVAALRQLEASSAEHAALQRRSIAQLERRVGGISSELARCVASGAQPVEDARVASAPLPAIEAPAEPLEDLELAPLALQASRERALGVAPLGVLRATYHFVADLLGKRESSVSDTVLAFRQELLNTDTQEE